MLTAFLKSSWIKWRWQKILLPLKLRTRNANNSNPFSHIFTNFIRNFHISLFSTFYHSIDKHFRSVTFRIIRFIDRLGRTIGRNEKNSAKIYLRVQRAIRQQMKQKCAINYKYIIHKNQPWWWRQGISTKMYNNCNWWLWIAVFYFKFVIECFFIRCIPHTLSHWHTKTHK